MDSSDNITANGRGVHRLRRLHGLKKRRMIGYVYISEKGTRTIIVDGEVYRWYLRAKDLDFVERHIAIQHSEARNGQMIMLDAFNTIWIMGLSPKFIRETILFALQQGWTPKASGNPIYLSVDKDGQIQMLPKGKQYRDLDYT